MLSARDVRGLLALPPTPCLESTDWWDPEANSVDLIEASRMARALVADGVGSIGLCGTTGECGALLWPEKAAFFGTVVDAVDGTVPVWCGTTALSTREVVRQMKAVRDLGGSGALVGLPMWQTPTPANAVRFYADLSEAVPDLPVLVYANSLLFKFAFGPQFWMQVCAQAPTVIAAKMGFVTAEHLEAVDGRVTLIAGEGGSLGAMYPGLRRRRSPARGRPRRPWGPNPGWRSSTRTRAVTRTLRGASSRTSNRYRCPSPISPRSPNTTPRWRRPASTPPVT